MKYKKTTLPNGLRLITVPMKDNPAVTVLVLVEAGSKYETKEQNGLSHFLEHMCFKGTVKRPSAFAITSELDALGAVTNAFTSREYTGYYAKAGHRHLETIVDVLSDIFLNSTFPGVEIEKEKKVISEEINMHQDDPQSVVNDLIYEMLYGDEPAGRDIAGTKETITKFTKANLVSYHQKLYVAPATTVVVAGEFGEDKTIALVKTKFDLAPNRPPKQKATVSDSQHEPQIKIKEKAVDQTHTILAVRTFKRSETEKNYQLAMLSSILGGGMSSRLFQKVREEMAAAYYVYASLSAYTDHGFLSIAAGLERSAAPAVLQAIIGECRRLKNELVPEEELRRVKEGYIGQLELSLETSRSVASFYGSQEIHHEEIENIADQVERLRQVTAEQIQTLANEIFINERLNLAVVGKGCQAADFAPFLKF